MTNPGPNPPVVAGDHSLALVPETVEELDGLERSRLYLTALGCPLELWEILLLTQSGAWDPRSRRAPTAHGTEATPVDALGRLRENEGPFIRDVRFFLERLPAPADLPRAELLIASLSGSRRNRATVLRWITDLARYRPEIERRIASLAWRAGRLLEQLDARRARAWEASLREAEPLPRTRKAEAPAPAFTGPVPPIPPRMLADLRRAHRGAYLMRQNLFHRVEPWEFVLMISSEGDRIREKLDALLVAERTGYWDPLEETALALVGRSVGVRHEWGSRMRELHRYLEGLCGVQGAALSVGVEILVAAPTGRRRATRWLESPMDHASEAVTYMGAVFAMASRHAAELEPDSRILLITDAA